MEGKWAGVSPNKFRDNSQCPECNFHLFAVYSAETVFKSVVSGIRQI